jgi:hypothetical protein
MSIVLSGKPRFSIVSPIQQTSGFASASSAINSAILASTARTSLSADTVLEQCTPREILIALRSMGPRSVSTIAAPTLYRTSSAQRPQRPRNRYTIIVPVQLTLKLPYALCP